MRPRPRSHPHGPLQPHHHETHSAHIRRIVHRQPGSERHRLCTTFTHPTRRYRRPAWSQPDAGDRTPPSVLSRETRLRVPEVVETSSVARTPRFRCPWSQEGVHHVVHGSRVIESSEMTELMKQNTAVTRTGAKLRDECIVLEQHDHRCRDAPLGHVESRNRDTYSVGVVSSIDWELRRASPADPDARPTLSIRGTLPLRSAQNRFSCWFESQSRCAFETTDPFTNQLLSIRRASPRTKDIANRSARVPAN